MNRRLHKHYRINTTITHINTYIESFYQDPLFESDFTIQGGSPCIDTGTADMDGDGVDDLAVGAAGGDKAYGSAGVWHWYNNRDGAVYILYMNADGSVKSTATIDKDTTNVPSSTETESYGKSIENLDLNSIGPMVEKHHFFPNKTNVEFIEVVNSNTIKMKVWERGAGVTLACGSGACAAVYAGWKKKLIEKNSQVQLEKGSLNINIDADQAIMTGPAEISYNGYIEI